MKTIWTLKSENAKDLIFQFLSTQIICNSFYSKLLNQKRII